MLASGLGPRANLEPREHLSQQSGRRHLALGLILGAAHNSLCWRLQLRPPVWRLVASRGASGCHTRGESARGPGAELFLSLYWLLPVPPPLDIVRL